jgi:hypothetical protein
MQLNKRIRNKANNEKKRKQKQSLTDKCSIVLFFIIFLIEYQVIYLTFEFEFLNFFS